MICFHCFNHLNILVCLECPTTSSAANCAALRMGAPQGALRGVGSSGLEFSLHPLDPFGHSHPLSAFKGVRKDSTLNSQHQASLTKHTNLTHQFMTMEVQEFHGIQGPPSATTRPLQRSSATRPLMSDWPMNMGSKLVPILDMVLDGICSYPRTARNFHNSYKF